MRPGVSHPLDSGGFPGSCRNLRSLVLKRREVVDQSSRTENVFGTASTCRRDLRRLCSVNLSSLCRWGRVNLPAPTSLPGCEHTGRRWPSRGGVDRRHRGGVPPGSAGPIPARAIGARRGPVAAGCRAALIGRADRYHQRRRQAGAACVRCARGIRARTDARAHDGGPSRSQGPWSTTRLQRVMVS